MASKVAVRVAAIVCVIVSILLATSSTYNLESSFESLPLYAPFINNIPLEFYVTAFAIAYLIEKKKYKCIEFYFFVLQHLAVMALMVYREIPSGGSAGIQGQ